MEADQGSEQIDIDAERFVSLEFSREWPKYVVSWWVRRRVGESDFPMATGSVERLPPQGEETLEQMWAELRQKALDQAMAASAEQPSAGPPKRRSLLDRLLRRS